MDRLKKTSHPSKSKRTLEHVQRQLQPFGCQKKNHRRTRRQSQARLKIRKKGEVYKGKKEKN